MVEQIKAYKTTDGKIFTEEKEALQYELKLKRLDVIADFVERHFWNGIDVSDIISLIDEHYEELKTAIGGITCKTN